MWSVRIAVGLRVIAAELWDVVGYDETAIAF